jgi:hypothetical protein
MATAMIYDTLKLAEQLEHEAGFDAPRAKAMARILAGNTGGNLATREDIQELATATREDIQKLAIATREDIQNLAIATREDIKGLATKGELQAGIQGVRNEVQGLRSEVQDIRGDIRVLYWMTGTTVAGIAGILGIAITVALHVMHLG